MALTRKAPRPRLSRLLAEHDALRAELYEQESGMHREIAQLTGPSYEAELVVREAELMALKQRIEQLLAVLEILREPEFAELYHSREEGLELLLERYAVSSSTRGARSYRKEFLR